MVNLCGYKNITVNVVYEVGQSNNILSKYFEVKIYTRK